MRGRAVPAVVAAAAVALPACSHDSGPARPTEAARHAPVVARPARGASGQAAIRRLIASGRPVYCGGRAKPYAALTFDDGPGAYTPLALRILRSAHAPATFFMVGRNVGPHRSLAVREARRHAVGNHTFDHVVLTALPPASARSEIVRAGAAIRRATGHDVRLFRPPFEAHDPSVDATARRLGLVEILWNVDSRDWAGANYAHIARNVERGLSPGAIVLMHENRGQTIRALKFLILPAMSRRHLHLVTVPRLLALDPPSRAQLRAGRPGCRYHAAGGPGS